MNKTRHRSVIVLALASAFVAGAVWSQPVGPVVGWGKYILVEPDALADIIAVAAGSSHSLALRPDGAIVAWGLNDLGQCDAATTPFVFAMVASGVSHSLAIARASPVSIDGGSGPQDEPAPAVPVAPAIGAVAPNPFNPRTTTIWLELPRAGTATLAVHDPRGRLVRTLWRGTLAAGLHPVAWDGLDDRGQPAAAGAYLVRLVTAHGEQRAVKAAIAK